MRAPGTANLERIVAQQMSPPAAAQANMQKLVV